MMALAAAKRGSKVIGLRGLANVDLAGDNGGHEG